MLSVNYLIERVMMDKDNLFYEWLFGRAEFPYYKDSITVPLPLNYEPDHDLEEIIGKGKGDPDIYGYPSDK